MLSTAYQMIDLRGVALKATDTNLPGIWNEVKALKKPVCVCHYSLSGVTTRYENTFKVPVLYADKVELIQINNSVTAGQNIQRIIIKNDDSVSYATANVENPTP